MDVIIQSDKEDEELKNKVRIMETVSFIEKEVKDNKPMNEERFREIVKGIIRVLNR